MNLNTLTILAAVQPFISSEPRPYKQPSLIVGSKGWVSQSSMLPGGTTST